MQGWIIIAAGFVYLLLLFWVASIGDWRAQKSGVKARPFIYALSLAVYCTSWTFFGSVGLAAERNYEFLGIYIGPILVFTFGHRLLRHIIRLAKAEKITSVADFLAARYGKSFAVASLATLIAVVGYVPYIALQLKAVAGTVGLVVNHYNPGFTSGIASVDIPLMIAGVLALFAILFGTRHTDATEHQDGLILAIALESAIKLTAFITVGFACTFLLFGSFPNLINAVADSPQAMAALNYQTSIGTWIVLILLSASAIIVLPRQFHVTIVENRSEEELKRAKWLFPVYLIAINIFVLPIALLGVLNVGTDTSADLYVLALPLKAGSEVLSMIAFVGGLSAATAMVIVASVALSIMLSNDLVLPLFLKGYLRHSETQKEDLSILILNTRRAAIVVILFAAFIYYREAANNIGLASIGLVSFAAVAQFMPALIGGLIWRGGNGRGAVLGMLSGFAVWCYTLLLPTVAPRGASFIVDGLFGIGHLRPEALFGMDAEPLSNGVFWSLLINTICYVFGSLSRKATPLERIQATVFVPRDVAPMPALRRFRTAVTVNELKATISRYLGAERTERSFQAFEQREHRQLIGNAPADIGIIRFSEQLLGSAVGSSSARLILSLLLQRNDSSRRNALRLLDDASEALQQNRDLLQIALDQMEQGITVLDQDYRLTCWNRQFRQLLDLPDEFGQVGTSFADMVQHLSRRGDLTGLTEAEAIKRMTRFGTPMRIDLKSTDRIIEIRSNPMPDGGIVATYTDITGEVEADMVLKQANELLENRVAKRTEELTHVNQELAQARAAAEAANLGKTRFLAAAGHDILQPLNAARLYSSSLMERLGRSRESELVTNIDSSLESVETILGAVLDISRLDTGAMKPNVSVFRLDQLMQQIVTDFTPMANAKSLRLRVVPSSVVLETDRNLLRRLLQNLVSNAIKYTRSGSVLFGVRRRGENVELQIIDTGIGIPKSKLRSVFGEFTRLNEGVREAQGLGLGLSIVDRIARVLKLTIKLDSTVGKGTAFSVILPVSSAKPEPVRSAAQSFSQRQSSLNGLNVLCIDNDQHILAGMTELLDGWGCRVTPLASGAELKQYFQQMPPPPDIILADYHLISENGLDMIGFARERFASEIPAVLITADRSNEVRDQAATEGVIIINKPLKPAVLRTILSRYHQPRNAAE
ncbi:MAG: hybrid sensor histidine kinase/response regulator [Phyllobacterium sp.]